MADITQLLPWVSEPYRREEVLAAARKLQPPFLLREAADATGLPIHIVQRVLSRLLKAGAVTRFKVTMSYPITSAGGRKVFIPGGKQRRVWAYTLAEPTE